MSDFLVQKLKTKEVFEFNTHAELLNKEFGTNYKAWWKCWWRFSNNTIVWFGRIDEKVRNEFKNSWLDIEKNSYMQSYAGNTGLYNGAPLDLDREFPYRLVFEIIDKPSRKYIFQGLFKLDRDNSTSVELVFRKISDTFPIN